MTNLRSASGAGNNGEPRIPLGVIVELGGQAQGSVINANQVEGAVWSTLIRWPGFSTPSPMCGSSTRA